MSQCELCRQPADCKVTWGLYDRGDKPMNTAKFCQQCAGQLWNGGNEREGYFAHAVAAGEMHFEIEPLIE